MRRFMERNGRTDRAPMPCEEAFEAIRRHPALPSPHGVAMEIMRLARSPECSLVRLATLVESDPSVAARVIQVVNSSAFPRTRPITSAAEAVAYLGTRMVQCIALSFSLVSTERRCRAFNYAGFWSGCLARAVGGERIAREIGTSIPDEVFTIGLLSEMGRLALAAVFPERYNTLLTSIRCDDLELIEAERELFDIDHNEVTARLMADWGFPDPVCDAVRLQYDARNREFDSKDEPNHLAATLALAARLSRQIMADDAESPGLADLVLDAGRLGLSAGGVLGGLQSVIPKWQEMLGMLNFRELTETQLGAVYEAAANLKAQLESQESN
jgi:two-component system, cell cycle response regulator